MTCEYPPQIGGVSSYVARVAEGLARAGQEVHVWCPPGHRAGSTSAGVEVHGEFGRFAPADLRHAGRLLDGFAKPRRMLVQWVPHGYGYKSLNVPFCWWLRERARSGDTVDLMVHEPFLAFAGGVAQRGAAAIHRMMTLILLGAARRVWVSTPAWSRALAPFAPSRDLGFDWLPVPSPVDVVDDPEGVMALRNRLDPHARYVIGHFGLYSRLTAAPLKAIVPRLLDRIPSAVVLLIGHGSERLRGDIVEGRSDVADRVHASGDVAPDALSRHLQACDLMLQPYPEGITGRRTSAMASLVHGLAVCTTAGEASEPLWSESGGVALVAPDNADAMVAEAERLLHDSCARRQLGTCAHALYEKRFDVRHTLNALLAA